MKKMNMSTRTIRIVLGISLILPLLVIFDSGYQRRMIKIGALSLTSSNLCVLIEGIIVSSLLNWLTGKMEETENRFIPGLVLGLLWLANIIFLDTVLLMTSSPNMTMLGMLNLFSLLLAGGILLPCADFQQRGGYLSKSSREDSINK